LNYILLLIHGIAASVRFLIQGACRTGSATVEWRECAAAALDLHAGRFQAIGDA
jgi:hypothetical protein